MSNWRELDKTVKQYILDNIDNSGYSSDELKTDAEKTQFLYDTFISEYQWSIDRYGMPRAMREWLSGLPSSINIEFNNADIINLAIKWEYIPANAIDSQCQKILDNWFNLLANKIVQLFRKYDTESNALPAMLKHQCD